MKKFLSYPLLSFLFLFFFIQSKTYSQEFPTDTGSKLIFGNIVFSSAGGDLYENADEDRVSSFTATPSFSFFVSPGLAIGGKGLYSYSGQGKNSETTFGIGPHIIYFFNAGEKPEKISGTTYFYTGAAFMYLHNVIEEEFELYDYMGFPTNDTDTDEYSTSGFAVSFGLGIIHMMSNSVGLDFELGYEIDSITPESADESISGNKINLLVGIIAFLY